MTLRWSLSKLCIALLATSIDLGRTVQAAGISYEAPDGTTKEVDDALLWGPYKPNLYFGVRARLPKSLITGLLWSRVDDYAAPQQSFRYTCEQNEGMAGYDWEEYDVRRGGRQVIHDAANQIDITTEFIKIPSGQHGGNWGVRIKGEPREGAPDDVKTAVVFYTAMEGAMGPNFTMAAETPNILHLVTPPDTQGFENEVAFRGRTPELGEFALEVTKGPASNQHPSPEHPSYEDRPLDRTMARSGNAPDEHLWQAKPIFFQTIKESVESYVKTYGEENLPPPAQMYTIRNGETGAGNMHLVQKVFQGAFEFDVLFTSGSSTSPMSSDALTREIKSASEAFNSDFKKAFPAQAPYDKSKYSLFAKSMFSNLLGGIGYFYGDSLVDRSYASEYEEDNEGFWEDAAEARGRNQQAPEGPYELFSAIPSRTFFPRGFLWDEGFHLLPVLDWDSTVAVDVLESWFSLMDDNGWIGREQILGAEARSKVPQEFQTQYPHYANPPTLFMALELLLDKYASGQIPADIKEGHLTTIRSFYPLLKRHYFWYRKTQAGDFKTYEREAFSSKEGYRWRGRTIQHILTSGLDDYPRAQPPHPGELHVDLMSWMGMMTRSMKRIANALGHEDDAEEFAGYETAITRNLDDLHWSKEVQTYCDTTIDDWEETSHVCHKGYISIFPFMTGMVDPNSPRLGAILDLISNPKELWSSHGIRSLSLAEPLYGTAENYWRSPIWINMNYLIVNNLLSIAQANGPHQKQARDIYTRLRRNLVDTVYESWVETGFAWEQYNPETGAGQRTQHFLGWTSLIVKIMCMPELGDDWAHGEL